MCAAFDDARFSTAIGLTQNFDDEYHGSWFQNLRQFEKNFGLLAIQTSYLQK